MKNFKFLLNYTQIFESRKEDPIRKEKARILYEWLLNSNAMQDIVALKEDYHKTTAREQRGSLFQHPSKAYLVNFTEEWGLKINFEQNFNPRDCYISVNPDCITINPDGSYSINTENSNFLFQTAERTASFIGDEEQIKSHTSYFRLLKNEDSKNVNANIYLPTNYITGEPVTNDIIFDPKTNKPIKQKTLNDWAIEWNKNYGADIIIDDKTDKEIQDQMKDFSVEYNAKMKENRIKQADKMNLKFVTYNSKDFAITKEFVNLEECLRWAWCFFVARKTSRVLDASKTFDYLLHKRKDLWGKKLPLGERYGEEFSPVDLNIGLGKEISKDEAFIESAYIDKKGLRGEVGKDIQEIKRTTAFIIRLYELLGLDIKAIEGIWTTKGWVSKGLKNVNELDWEKAVESHKYIMGFNISNILSKPGTILGAAAQTFTSKDVKYMNSKLAFELSPRSEFKVSDSGVKIPTTITSDMINVFFECRTEEEAFKKLLYGYDNVEALILQAFSARESVIVGEKEVKKKSLLALITTFTNYIRVHANEFVPIDKETFANEIPYDIAIDDVRILHGIIEALNSAELAGKSRDIKTILNQQNKGLYDKLISAGMKPIEAEKIEKPETSKTDKKARLKGKLD